jgi:hypothetical protein
MTLRELIDELQARRERLGDAPVYVWHDRGGSEPVRAVGTAGPAGSEVVVIHAGEGRVVGRMPRQA